MPSVTPDLRPPEAPLAPVFPLGRAARSLTLYPGEAGEVRVHWQLRADAVMGHGACFPSSDGAPRLVLRLRRLRAEGGCEPVQERSLRPSGLGASGEVAFRVGGDGDLFEAELGLMNPEGGWLLLARSNRLQTARGLGLELLKQPSLRQAPAVWSPPEASVAAESLDTAPAEVEHPTAGNRCIATPIPVLTYAGPIPALSGVVITAELHLHGWSAPDTEIDLFGHRYRVGPGGRFQLSLTVDDPELIRRALQQHPPSESVDPR